MTGIGLSTAEIIRQKAEELDRRRTRNAERKNEAKSEGFAIDRDLADLRGAFRLFCIPWPDQS